MSNLKKIFGDSIEIQIQKAISDGGNCIVTIADPIGKHLAKTLSKKQRLSRSQIRNIYTMAKRMQMKGIDFEQFILLKPKIVYITRKKNASLGSEILGDILLLAVDETYRYKNKDHFKNFMNFFESILAYHVSYGGK